MSFVSEVKVTPESYRTSVVTPIKLSSTDRTETSFAVRQVDNHKNTLMKMGMSIKNTFAITKNDTSTPGKNSLADTICFPKRNSG